MRIAHIVSTFRPYAGGMGNATESIVGGLRVRGYDITVLTPAYGKQMPSEPGLIRLQPWFAFRNSAFVPTLYKNIDQFDILHLHYPFYGGAELTALHRLVKNRTRLILHYHMDVVGNGWVKSFFNIYKRTLWPAIRRTADEVLVSSHDYAKASNYLSGRMATTEVPFGVSDDFRPSEQGCVKKTVLFVGALDKAHYFKGLSLLISAFARMKDTPVDLRIIGDGELRPQYEAQAKQSGVKASFLGKVSRDQLIREYQQAYVTVLPSTDSSEAFGLVLLESMACGTPVIASDLPGVRSVALNGGILVPSGNVEYLQAEIEHLVAHPKKRQALSDKALVAVGEKYRWPRIIDKLETVYQKHRPIV